MKVKPNTSASKATVGSVFNFMPYKKQMLSEMFKSRKVCRTY